MSSNNTVFSTLISSYPTWSALSAYLRTAEGGNLRIDDHSTPMNPFAIIRYTKGHSDMTLPHVRAFRSVVWDTLENRPVSVTAFKSHDSESLPIDKSLTDFTAEYFLDGVLIGMFWDKYNHKWRIHTRSTLDAQCRYFSQTMSFNAMFAEAIGDHRLTIESALNVNTSYTWILQHPENRIVVPVKSARAHCVEAIRIENNGSVSITGVPDVAFPVPKIALTSWAHLQETLNDWNSRFGHTIQGIVVKSGFERYKVRTNAYNFVRRRRGNSARRDYLWLTEWRSGTLAQYLSLYPEERGAANVTIARWKQATNEVYHWYVSVFKARDTPKQDIPPKYRPLVYGLHNLYMTTLKPVGKSLDWKMCLAFMNERDTAQMLFVINWDLRQTAKRLGISAIPIEPPAVAAGSHVDDDDHPDTTTPSEVAPSSVSA